MIATAISADDPFRWGDDLGPAKVVHVAEPRLGLRATLVVDNVACGPAIGRLRMAPDVTTEECVRLARAMTLKNAAAGLPHGGGKSVLRGDPRMPRAEKEALFRAFAHALRHEGDYIFGPDMGTDEARKRKYAVIPHDAAVWKGGAHIDAAMKGCHTAARTGAA